MNASSDGIRIDFSVEETANVLRALVVGAGEDGMRDEDLRAQADRLMQTMRGDIAIAAMWRLVLDDRLAVRWSSDQNDWVVTAEDS